MSSDKEVVRISWWFS